MSNQNCCDSRKHLVELGRQIFRGQDISNSQLQSNEWISLEGARQIVEMRKQERLARQTLRVLQEIRSKSTVNDIENSYNWIEESPSIKTIKEIAGCKVNIILQAEIFESILKNKEGNLKAKFVSMVSSIFKIAKKEVKDLQPIFTNYPTFLSIFTSLSFFEALKQESQKTKIEDLEREIQRLNKILEGWRQRVKQCEEENEFLRSQINKNKSKQVILEDKDFSSNYQFEDISKKRLSDVYEIKGLEEMNLNISSKKEQTSIACSTIVPFQEKLFVDQQSITFSHECPDSQSQTDDFGELIAEYVRPLDEAVNQKQQQALEWRRRHQDTMVNLNNAQIQLAIIKEMYRPKTLFQGQIFEDNQNEKKILIKHIEEKGEIMINSTRLLYRYDPRNKTNFHEYIDGVEGLALIVKSKRGFLFGGYYSGKIEPEQVLNQFGLLISISNDSSYPMIEPDRNARVVRAMIYDPFYVIFGNAQLRVKSGQDFIFSNFGIMNSYFRHNNRRLIDFVGEQNKEVKFETYQFYQVRLASEE